MNSAVIDRPQRLLPLAFSLPFIHPSIQPHPHGSQSARAPSPPTNLFLWKCLVPIPVTNPALFYNQRVNSSVTQWPFRFIQLNRSQLKPFPQSACFNNSMNKSMNPLILSSHPFFHPAIRPTLFQCFILFCLFVTFIVKFQGPNWCRLVTSFQSNPIQSNPIQSNPIWSNPDSKAS